ncbi:MAG: dTDP-4-dehydrorhamnose 3,5-epimerase [Bacteroidetes bacterium]|nr:MAG: dTDP-4-dehydrorhamnose 3,5-epimerase [Bacteroidota bacterium]
MILIETGFKDLLIIEPRVFEDERGYFMETYNAKLFQDAEVDHKWVQDNQSRSTYGVIRGLHYQLNPKAQAKLVRVLEGNILDVAVDLRKNSETFGRWFATELSEDNKKQLLIPRGFAHGFSVLSKSATVFYKCDNLYAPEMERSIDIFDKKLNIDWKIETSKTVVSEKDRSNASFLNAEYDF